MEFFLINFLILPSTKVTKNMERTAKILISSCRETEAITIYEGICDEALDVVKAKKGTLDRQNAA